MQFLELVAVPAYIGLLVVFGWGYRDLRKSLGEHEQKAATTTARFEAENTAIRLSMQTMTIEIMKQYVPKDDVLRLENRLMEALTKMDEKLERIISK